MTTAREVEAAVQVRELVTRWMADDTDDASPAPIIPHPNPCGPCRHGEDPCERYGQGRSCNDAELLAIELRDVGVIWTLVTTILGDQL